MRHWLATKLRRAATLLDGEDFRKLADQRWELHKAQIQAIDKYVGTAERYIVALERALGAERTVAIRKKYPGRFDTAPLIEAGAWRSN